MKNPDWLKEVLDCDKCRFSDSGKTLLMCPKHADMLHNTNWLNNQNAIKRDQ